MIQKIKHTIKNNKTIVGNIFSLGTLQIFNYALPLITLPYLLRVLGPEKYGIIAFFAAFVGYFVIIVNYGFNYTVTKEISIHRKDIDKISEIFWNVISIKILLSLISFIIATIIIYSFDVFSENHILFFFSFLTVIGEVFFPIWLFQGIENMKYVTIINIIIKTLFLVPIFLFIQLASDYVWLPLITSLSFVLSGIVAFIVAIVQFHIRFISPTFSSLQLYLTDGWHVFISTVFISLYTTSTTFILGLFTTPIIVGYYASAEKIVKAFQGVLGPISQSIYPHIAEKFSYSREKTILFLQKLTGVIGFGTLVLSSMLYFGADYIILLFSGEGFYESVVILKVLSFLPFIVGLSNIFGVLTMLNFGYKEQFSKILGVCSFSSLLLSIPLTILYAGTGLAFAVVFTELTIAIAMFLFLHRRGIHLLPLKIKIGK